MELSVTFLVNQIVVYISVIQFGLTLTNIDYIPY